MIKDGIYFLMQLIQLKKIYEANVLGREFNYSKIEIDNTFPDFIQNNKEKFKEWIL